MTNEKAMTNRQAIDLLKEVSDCDDSMYAYNPAYMLALDLAISALEKQEQVVDASCETCKYKNRPVEEPPCCDCYMSTAFDDSYEPYTEEEA